MATHPCDRDLQGRTPDDVDHVLLPLDPSRYGPSQYEAVHAERLGPSRHRLLNIPFHARGYNLLDVVATRKEPCGCILARRPLTRSGHTTWWALVRAGVTGNALFEASWRALEARGCQYEDTGPCLAIDVPPGVDPAEVRALLARGMLEGVWVVDPSNPQGGTGATGAGSSAPAAA